MEGQQARELQMRILDRKSVLIDELVQIAGHQSGESARRTIKAKLHQLSEIIRNGVVDGWANISDLTKDKLDHWLGDAPEATAPSSVESWEDEGGAVPLRTPGIDDQTLEQRLDDRARSWSAELNRVFDSILHPTSGSPSESTRIVRGRD
jgi:hypothetical protein